MKGMQKIKRGKQFEGAVFYVLKPGKHHKCDPYVIGGNLVCDMATEVIEEFNQSKQLRPDIQKAVWHNALRLKQGEMLSANAWVSFADDYMKRMGFSETHLRCYVLHDDEAGQHIHIIASRIDVNGGKLYLGKNENLISTRIISELEIAHNLTVTKTAPAIASKQPKRRKVSRNEEMLSERTGLPSPKEALQQIIDKSLADKPDVLTFTKRLEEAEVGWTANVASTGKMNGFSFSYRVIAFKASQLGKKYSWSNLQKYLDYQPDRDNSLLLNTRQ
ncbi:relaxase/mobilization nuclease domain-containing protein, partial [Yersinia enterocolitica]